MDSKISHFSVMTSPYIGLWPNLLKILEYLCPSGVSNRLIFDCIPLRCFVLQSSSLSVPLYYTLLKTFFQCWEDRLHIFLPFIAGVLNLEGSFEIKRIKKLKYFVWKFEKALISKVDKNYFKSFFLKKSSKLLFEVLNCCTVFWKA